MKNSRHLPFIPYSNSGLREGDFWILTLEDRSFSAGRVLRPSLNLSRTKFVGGLINWHDKAPPSADALENGISCS